MKQFINHNWYRLSMAVAALVFSFGFFVWAVKNNSAKAGESSKTKITDRPEGELLAVGANVYLVYWNENQYKFVFKNVPIR